MIVLDSTLEIAFKEWLVNESGAAYADNKIAAIFSDRRAVQSEIKRYPQVKVKADTWKKIDYYYRLRCKLVHERATVNVTDDQIGDFREAVEGVLKKLFRLKLGED